VLAGDSRTSDYTSDATEAHVIRATLAAQFRAIAGPDYDVPQGLDPHAYSCFGGDGQIIDWYADFNPVPGTGDTIVRGYPAGFVPYDHSLYDGNTVLPQIQAEFDGTKEMIVVSCEFINANNVSNGNYGYGGPYSGQTNADILARHVQFCADRIGEGYSRAYIATDMAWSTVSDGEARRVAFNAALTALRSPSVTGVIPYGSNPAFTQAGITNTRNYQPDLVHLADGGVNIQAHILYNVVVAGSPKSSWSIAQPVTTLGPIVDTAGLVTAAGPAGVYYLIERDAATGAFVDVSEVVVS